MSVPDTPESIKCHSTDYSSRSWCEYTPQELGQWVHLLLLRARHRVSPVKAEKDIYDAQNYLNMLQAHVDAAKDNPKEIEYVAIEENNNALGRQPY